MGLISRVSSRTYRKKQLIMAAFNVQSSSDALNPKRVPDYVDLGTTIMAVEFDGGVVFGADSRTSAGSFIVNRVTDKLTKISDNIYCCRSGSAADTQAIANIVKANLEMHEIELNTPPQVSDAAAVFKQYCYGYRDQLMAGIIVAGYDEIIGGSGSTWIYGHVDNTYKPGMTKEECLQFVKTCITLAIGRDSSSGGCIRLAVIDKSGVERHVIEGNQIEKIAGPL